jgi:hypothetical protein
VNFVPINPQHKAPVYSTSLCSNDPRLSNLDPYIFVDPATGLIWLLYSQQSLRHAATTGGSLLRIQQLNADGTAPMPGTSPVTMVTYAQVAGINPNEGTNPRIENPAMVIDHFNQYDLIFSLGTYRANATYITAETACTIPLTGHHPNPGCNAGDTREIMKGGGASPLLDTSPAAGHGNRLIWDCYMGATTPCGSTCSSGGKACGTSTYGFGLRVDLAGPTSEKNVNPSERRSKSSQNGSETRSK